MSGGSGGEELEQEQEAENMYRTKDALSVLVAILAIMLWDAGNFLFWLQIFDREVFAGIMTPFSAIFLPIFVYCVIKDIKDRNEEK